jgi:hypothetical protein
VPLPGVLGAGPIASLAAGPAPLASGPLDRFESRNGA